MDEFNKRGWTRIADDPGTKGRACHARNAGQLALGDPKLAQWYVWQGIGFSA